jgi:hypothetical protein
MAYILLNGVAIIGLWSYFLIPARVNQPEFEVLSIVETYRHISDGETFPVDKIVSEMSDNEVFLLQASNVARHYDPLFTDASQFAPRVHDGSVFEIQNGFYNFSDPTGYVFPEVNGSQIYDLIPVNEASKLEDFVNRRQPDWKIPTVQIILDWTAGITFIVMVLYPIKALIMKISWMGRKIHPISQASGQ